MLAAVTVAGVSLALTELCPVLFTVLVNLASPEWKVLTRSMTYESATTGSPVLAVFTAGARLTMLPLLLRLGYPSHEIRSFEHRFQSENKVVIILR